MAQPKGATAAAVASAPVPASGPTPISPLPLDSSLLFKLVRVVNLTARPFVETLASSHQISLNEWRAMVVLASHPGCAAHEVAEYTGLDKMSVSRAIAALARHRRIRKQADRADARRVCLHLNVAGQALFQAIGSQAALREAQIFQSFNAMERLALSLSIDRLLDAVAAVPTPLVARPSKTEQA